MILFPEKIGVIGGQLVEHQLQVLRGPGGRTDAPERTEIRIAPLPQRMGETAGDQLALFAQVDAVILLNEAAPGAGNPRRRWYSIVKQHIQEGAFTFRASGMVQNLRRSQRPAWSGPSSREHMPETRFRVFWAGAGRMACCIHIHHLLYGVHQNAHHGVVDVAE